MKRSLASVGCILAAMCLLGRLLQAEIRFTDVNADRYWSLMEGAIGVDGFESGDLSAWTRSVP